MYAALLRQTPQRYLQSVEKTYIRHFAACCSAVLNTKSLTPSTDRAARQLAPAQPGTVSYYDQHILLRVAPPPDRANNDASASSVSAPWWPVIIEKQPAVVEVFKTLAVHQSNISNSSQRHSSTGTFAQPKVTLYEHQDNSNSMALEKDCVDAIFFPAGTMYSNLHLSLLPSVVAHDVLGNKQPLPLDAKKAQNFALSSLTILVCCHGARDARCGDIGPPLAAALAEHIRRCGLSSRQFQVFKCSHIGGHKYAGNVIVYCARHPSDGDWYGGLQAEHASDFIDALITMELGFDGGAEDDRLRKFWRGRMGLTKEEQREVFELGGLVEEVGSEWEGDGEGEEEEELEDGRK